MGLAETFARATHSVNASTVSICSTCLSAVLSAVALAKVEAVFAKAGQQVTLSIRQKQMEQC